MKINYYSGWFDGALPEQLAESLRKDIVDRSSIAIIWGAWAIEEYAEIAKNDWLDPAGIVFDKYHAIDPRMDKAAAQAAVRDAAVILLMGGDTVPQRDFLTEYDLAAPIKESRAAVIFGTSAGSKNMGEKFVCAIDCDHEAEERAVYDGLGLDGFAYEPYFSLDKAGLIQNYLLPLSQEIDIYATSDGAAIRVENGAVTVVTGDAYLISGAEIRKMQ